MVDLRHQRTQDHLQVQSLADTIQRTQNKVVVMYTTYTVRCLGQNQLKYEGMIKASKDFPCGSAGKNLPAMRETWVRSLGW